MVRESRMTPPFLAPAVPPLAPAPVRDASLDTARGAAILGLIFSNMPSFASADLYREWIGIPAARDSRVLVADFLIEWLIVGKCVAILSFLLGSGLAMQQRKAEAAGRSFPTQTARRMAALFGIGILHIVFLWAGDILCAYALLGLALLIFHRMPPAGLRWMAGGGMALIFLVVGGLTLLGTGAPDSEFDTAAEGWVKFIETTYQQGPIHMLVLVRLGEAALMQGMMIFIMPFSLAIVLLGYDAERSGWFPWRGRAWPPVLVGLLAAGGLIVCGISAWLTTYLPSTSLANAAGFALSLPASLLLAAAFLHGLLRLPDCGLQRAVSAVGRTALSNYLLQSLCAAVIFHSWGLGLYGRLAPGQTLALCLGIVALQLAWPAWWLRHFHFGPMEYLWRRFSYDSHTVPFRRN